MRKQTKRWKTREGSKIRICDMEDSHLINSINMLKRKAERYKYTVPYPMFNGEMAQMMAEREYDVMMDMTDEELAEDLWPIFEQLMLDACRRQLSVAEGYVIDEAMRIGS